MFKSFEDEDELIKVFTALCQEFGPDKITLHCPAIWFHPDLSLAPAKVVFDLIDTLEVRVTFNNSTFIAKVVELVKTQFR